MSDIDRRRGDAPLIAGLAAGMSVRDAARAAGIAEATAHRRLGDAGFRAEVAAARSRLVDLALGQLADAAAEAVVTLRALLAADSDQIRLGSARAILDSTIRLREHAELAERVAVLEAATRAAA